MHFFTVFYLHKSCAQINIALWSLRLTATARRVKRVHDITRTIIMGLTGSQPQEPKDLDDFVLVKQTLKTPPIKLYWKEDGVPPLSHLCVHLFAFNLEGFSSKLKLLPADLKNKIIVYCLRHEIVNSNQLSLLIDVNTRSLNLHASKTKDLDLQNILPKCPELEELDISGNLRLTDLAIECIVAKCPKLKKLNLAACLGFGPRTLSQLKHLKQLEELNLYYCGDSNLTTCIEEIAANCPNLVSLNLGGIPLSRATIKYLADRCGQLMALNLCGCKLVDADLKHLSRLKNLISLNISSNLELTNKGVKLLAEFKYLQRLDLFGIGRAEGFDDAMIEVFEACSGLEEVSLASCTALTDAAVMHLADHCPRLSSLQLSNTHVTDAGVITLLDKCDYLRRLHVSATSVTDQTLFAICTGRARRQLDELDLSFCKELTDEGVKQLFDQCEFLQRVVLSQRYGLNITLLRSARPFLVLECPDQR